MKVDPAAYFAWLPPKWHRSAAAWRARRGPILASDGFVSHLERKRGRKPKPKRKEGAR